MKLFQIAVILLWIGTVHGWAAIQLCEEGQTCTYNVGESCEVVHENFQVSGGECCLLSQSDDDDNCVLTAYGRDTTCDIVDQRPYCTEEPDGSVFCLAGAAVTLISSNDMVCPLVLQENSNNTTRPDTEEQQQTLVENSPRSRDKTPKKRCPLGRRLRAKCGH